MCMWPNLCESESSLQKFPKLSRERFTLTVTELPGPQYMALYIFQSDQGKVSQVFWTQVQLQGLPGWRNIPQVPIRPPYLG